VRGPPSALSLHALTRHVRAGSISQTLTYPFDVVRRKMQVVGMKSDVYGPKYGSALGAVRGIVRTEGVRGLYRGLWANLRASPCCAQGRGWG
jgi:solute carrier family 25 phosphate transporter 23/24/25/41